MSFLLILIHLFESFFYIFSCSSLETQRDLSFYIYARFNTAFAAFLPQLARLGTFSDLAQNCTRRRNMPMKMRLQNRANISKLYILNFIDNQGKTAWRI